MFLCIAENRRAFEQLPQAQGWQLHHAYCPVEEMKVFF